MENANYLSGEKGLDVDVDRLFVKSAIANEGPRMKRIRPAPMGRAYRYQRRIAHIEIVLAEKGGQNGAGLATVVGEEDSAAAEEGRGQEGGQESGSGKEIGRQRSSGQKVTEVYAAPQGRRSL